MRLPSLKLASLDIKTLSGYGVALGCALFLLALIPGLGGLLILSGMVYWAVFVSAWQRLNRRNKRQCGFLLVVGVVALVVAVFTDVTVPVFSLLQGNLAIVAMLTGVSLLGLLPDSTKPKPPMTGVKGFASTWASIQLLGAVINMSAVFVVGDKLQRQSGQLSGPQYSILVRALTSAGWWSPFFASVAVALSIAPDAEFHHLAVIGLPLSIMACALSCWEFKRSGQIEAFQGFPLSVSSLAFPVLLAALVLIFHYFVMPEAAILSIVTLLSPISVVLFLFLRGGPRHTRQRLRDHAHIRLPNMANEVSLFLAAGFLSTTVSLALQGLLGEGWSLFDHFGFFEAYLCFLVICGISLMGLHPIVGISLMSSMVPASGADNTLLAFVSLCTWAVGTAISPLSGINLSVAGKYGADNFAIARSNWFYGALMAGVVALAMLVLTWTLP
ncbi:hypothetical protein ACFQ45_07470 [Rhodanobacter aciditrophus]|uniref:Uncharacterized protein n=1 Tax=Rhodanobacter aciditrophus TaxID=1623218 RepID=A0ABW4B1V1_9GAMM